MDDADSLKTSAIHSPTAAAARLLSFLLWSLLIIPPYALVLALGRRTVPLCRRIARFYWHVVCKIVGLEVVVQGVPCAHKPTLYLANHASYLDILVLGSQVESAFVAKKEVGQWPGIGILAKLGRTVFVDRRPRKSLQQRDEMLGRLAEVNESLILFPEGTSNDGNLVLPFKSALLSVAEQMSSGAAELPVQPVSVAYTRLGGLPMGRCWRPFFAWYGDMELAPHLWFFLGLGTTRVEVTFHPVVSLAQFGSRKALADHCHAVVSRGVVASNIGRPLPVAVDHVAPDQTDAPAP